MKLIRFIFMMSIITVRICGMEEAEDLFELEKKEITPRVKNSFLIAFMQGQLQAFNNKTVTFVDYKDESKKYNYSIMRLCTMLESLFENGVKGSHFETYGDPTSMLLLDHVNLEKNLNILKNPSEEDKLMLNLGFFCDFLETVPLKRKKDQRKFRAAIYAREDSVKNYIQKKIDPRGDLAVDVFIDRMIAISLNRKKLAKAFMKQNPLAINEACRYSMHLATESLDQKIAEIRSILLKKKQVRHRSLTEWFFDSLSNFMVCSSKKN